MVRITQVFFLLSSLKPSVRVSLFSICCDAESKKDRSRHALIS